MPAVKWMLLDRYDSVRHLENFNRPVVVAVAERDSIVLAHFGIALHESLHGTKRLMVIMGSDHNDWPLRTDAAWWRDATESFFSRSRLKWEKWENREGAGSSITEGMVLDPEQG